MDNNYHEQTYKKGFPKDWAMNWIKPIHKGEDKKKLYPTINMPQYLNYGQIILHHNETKDQPLSQKSYKRSLGQVDFKPNNIPLSIIWLHFKGNLYIFMNFQKSFNIIPRSAQKRMVDIRMPLIYRVDVTR